MIFRKALSIAAAIGAVLAGAGTVVVAGAYALYAWMKLYMPTAGAAAVVAAVAALVVLAAALFAVSAAKPPRRKPDPAEPQSLLDRAMGLARDKPLVAAGGALAAGLIALRNPALITALIGMAAGQAGKPKR